MRLVLDKAATVDEAVELLQQYNIYFSGDMAGHYQIASNFIAYNGVNIGGGGTEFKRYDTVEKEILDNNGVLNEDDVVSILAEVGVRDGDIDKLQWSVVYNLTTGEVHFLVTEIRIM